MNTKKTWIKNLDTKQDVEYIKAFFSIDKRYSSHRHDTYAIGITFSGVQSFHYRKEMQHSLPWHAMILHPDEAHDGFAGSDAGFYYHMLYIKPEKIQEILKGKPLPFINEGISQDRYLINSIYQLMQSFENTEELLQVEDAMYDLTMNLYRSSGVLAGARKIINDRSVRQAKDYMLDNLTSFLTLDDIASQVNVDKWSLSRDFRLLLGTSPHRYITMRRLEIVKKLLLAGMGFADSSISAGFFDQGHMIRHFKKTFGLLPSQWLGLFSSN